MCSSEYGDMDKIARRNDKTFEARPKLWDRIT
jgi:hypothetical protein